jgi:hypothetical protein
VFYSPAHTLTAHIFHVNFALSSIFSASLVRKLIKKFNPARDEKNKFISSPETLGYREKRKSKCRNIPPGHTKIYFTLALPLAF